MSANVYLAGDWRKNLLRSLGFTTSTKMPLAFLQGSGLSDGDYVTLGANEVEDLESLVAFIRQGGHTSLIALWGRSMGAVSALLYSVRDPSVAGIVVDSPFSRLTDLMWEILEDRKIPMRKVLGGTVLKLMRRCAFVCQFNF